MTQDTSLKCYHKKRGQIAIADLVQTNHCHAQSGHGSVQNHSKRPISGVKHGRRTVLRRK